MVAADAESLETEEDPPSLAEGWRMCWQIDSLRRIYRTLPFLTPAVAGFAIFSSFMYRGRVRPRRLGPRLGGRARRGAVAARRARSSAPAWA